MSYEEKTKRLIKYTGFFLVFAALLVFTGAKVNGQEIAIGSEGAGELTVETVVNVITTEESLTAAIAESLSEVPGVVITQDNQKLKGSVTATVASSYIWRGQVIDKNFCFFGDILIEYENFFVDLWAYRAGKDRGGEERLGEIDFTAGYSFSNIPGAPTVSVISYQFPGGSSNSWEVQFGIEQDIGFGSVGFNSFFDTEEQGFYNSFAYAYPLESLPLVDSATLHTSLGIGSEEYNEFYFGDPEAGFNDFTLGVSADKSLSFADLSFDATYSDPLDSKLVDPSLGFSVSVSRSF